MKLVGGLFIAVFVCALPAGAFAQGYNSPPPPGGPVGPEPPGAVTQFRWDVGVIIGIPGGDLDNGADTSPGLRLAVGYNFNPNVSAHASLRYILVNSEDDAFDISYYDLGIGGRYTIATAGNLNPFVEGELLYATVSVDSDFGSADESDPAIAFRVGGIYKWRPNLDIIFYGSYTNIFVDEGETGLSEANWIELGGGIQGYF